jgi:hypothetical protein
MPNLTALMVFGELLRLLQTSKKAIQREVSQSRQVKALLALKSTLRRRTRRRQRSKYLKLLEVEPPKKLRESNHQIKLIHLQTRMCTCLLRIT